MTDVVRIISFINNIIPVRDKICTSLFVELSAISAVIFVLVVPFQVDHHAGLRHLVTAAARATKARARVRAAPPSTSSPPPAPRANQKPVPLRGRSSADPSPDKHASRRWTGRPRKKDQEVTSCSSSNLSSGVRAISFALSPPAHGTPAAARNDPPKRK